MQYWEDEYFVDSKDITIIVENKKYELNKFILYSSSFLKILISGNFSEAQEKVIILDVIKKEIWEIILNYLYSSFFNVYIEKIGLDMQLKKFKLPTLDIYNFFELYSAVDSFDLPKLKKKLEKQDDFDFDFSGSDYDYYYDLLDDIIYKYPIFANNLMDNLISNIANNLSFLNGNNSKDNKNDNFYLKQLDDIVVRYPTAYDSLAFFLLDDNDDINFANACVTEISHFKNLCGDNMFNAILKLKYNKKSRTPILTYFKLESKNKK